MIYDEVSSDGVRLSLSVVVLGVWYERVEGEKGGSLPVCQKYVDMYDN